MGEKYLTLIGHLEELRKALLIILLSLIPGTLLGWFLKDYTMWLLLRPLLVIDPNFKLIVLGVADKIFVDLKIALFSGIFFALPVIFWQVWGFILPALRAKEKQLLQLLVPVTTSLFLGGIVFAYLTVFQLGVQFFFTYAQADAGYVQAAYALKQYVDFTMMFLFPFGIVFQLPVIILILAKFELITPQSLREKRKYTMLAILVIAAIITPGPDLISQVLVALPMFVLYELSIGLTYMLPKFRRG